MQNFYNKNSSQGRLIEFILPAKEATLPASSKYLELCGHPGEALGCGFAQVSDNTRQAVLRGQTSGYRQTHQHCLVKEDVLLLETTNDQC